MKKVNFSLYSPNTCLFIKIPLTFDLSCMLHNIIRRVDFGGVSAVGVLD